VAAGLNARPAPQQQGEHVPGGRDSRRGAVGKPGAETCAPLCVCAGGAHRARARVRGGLAVTRARARECTRVSSAPACPSESGRARAGEVGAAIPGAERRLRRVSGPWRLGCCWADAGGGTERLDPVWCVVHSCVVIHGCMHAYTRACERERKGVKRGRGRPGGGVGGQNEG